MLKASRKKRIAAGSGTTPEAINKLLKMHRGMADMMKAMGAGKRGPMAGLAAAMGFGGGGMPSPEQMAEARQENAGRAAGGLPPTMPKLPPNIPGIPGLARPRQRKVSRIAGAARPRKEEMIELQNSMSQKGNLKCLSSSAWPAPEPRSGRSITSSSPTRARPRDGRFIERLGYFNPLLPKEKNERLKLDLDKVKAWMKKGAQPSDRVMRFLDAAGIVKREKRNNPEKAIPRKERKAKAEEATKAKEGADAAAKTAATAKANEKAAADKAKAAEKAGRRAGGELTLAVSRRGPTASALPASAPRTAFAAR